MTSLRIAVAVLAFGFLAQGARRPKLNGVYDATAYTIEGQTDSGIQTRRGVVAADPELLPFGTRIRISEAGKYSGDYLVADSGRKIQGRELDIYIRNNAEAKAFGKQKVKVRVLKMGTGEIAGKAAK
jgi:3D (Asp-Asp-Asp) domain-containing protein